MKLICVPEGHELRHATELFISETYKAHYEATIPRFPPMLIAMLSCERRLLCASGLRFSQNGFFSNAYLDRPIERALAERTGQFLSATDVFEVTTFASRAPHVAPRFLNQIVAYGGHVGFEWAFFTATARLRALLQRLGLTFVTLGPADPARLPNADFWGTYYERSPLVCAVNRAAAARFLKQKLESAVHA